MMIKMAMAIAKCGATERDLYGEVCEIDHVYLSSYRWHILYNWGPGLSHAERVLISAIRYSSLQGFDAYKARFGVDRRVNMCYHRERFAN